MDASAKTLLEPIQDDRTGLPVGWHLRFIRPTEFGSVEGDDCGLTPEAALIAKADRRVAERRRWRGGGGSH